MNDGYISIRLDFLGAENVLCGERTQWALNLLKDELLAKSVGLAYAGKADYVIALAGPQEAAKLLAAQKLNLPEKHEALAIFHADDADQKRLVLCGYDDSGLMYAVLEVYDCIHCGKDTIAALDKVETIAEAPLNQVRSMKRIFCSEIEDKPWFYDHNFWDEYLTGLAVSRINRMNLTLGMGMDNGHDPNLRDNYLCFSYPFFVATPEYPGVYCRYLSEEERQLNLETLRYIALQCHKRGIQFQLALWTHAYKLVGCDNENYPVMGLNPENHADYCRCAMRTLLRACPGIDGITLRVHYECGIPEPAHEFWRIVLEGVKECGRKVELDIHAKGTDANMVKVATDTGMDVLLACKYHAEHFGLPYQQAQIRPTEMPGIKGDYPEDKMISFSLRRHARYGYADYMREDRDYSIIHRVFPGTQRLLLWGDPLFAAAHSRNGVFCGSKGIEFMEPMTYKARKDSGFVGGREPYAAPELRFAPNAEWKKYLYFYRVWGRFLYNPDASQDVWMRYLKSEFGDAAVACGDALAYASRVLPLISMAHLPSAAHARLWMEMYTNMSIVEENSEELYGDTPQPRKFNTVSPLDPEMFYRICDYVEDLLAGRLNGKYTPMQVADWLLELADKCEAALEEAQRRIEDPHDAEYRRVALDARIELGIGRFFAHKFRAGVYYELYLRTRQTAELKLAIEEYELACEAWRVLAKAAMGQYRVDLTFGHIAQQRGCWMDRIPAIEEDIERMRVLLKQAAPSDAAAEQPALIGYRSPLSLPQLSHEKPASFTPGKAVCIRLNAPENAEVKLHYRHVSQGELYNVVPMNGQNGVLEAEIPADYTNSPFPLMYWFELRQDNGAACFFPGLGEHLDAQPYYTVRCDHPTDM